MAMRDRVGRAGLDAVSTEDASRIVDIIDTGVAFAGGDALGFGIIGGFDIDTLRGTGRGTEKAADAFFQAVFVAVENMDAAITSLEMHGLVRVILGGRLSPKIAKSNAEAFGQRRDRATDFLKDGRHNLLTNLPAGRA